MTKIAATSYKAIVNTGAGTKIVTISENTKPNLFFCDTPANLMNAQNAQNGTDNKTEQWLEFEKELNQHLTENDNDKIHDILYSRATHRKNPNINVDTPLTINAHYLNTYPLIFEHLQKRNYTFTPV